MMCLNGGEVKSCLESVSQRCLRSHKLSGCMLINHHPSWKAVSEALPSTTEDSTIISLSTSRVLWHSGISFETINIGRFGELSILWKQMALALPWHSNRATVKVVGRIDRRFSKGVREMQLRRD